MIQLLDRLRASDSLGYIPMRGEITPDQTLVFDASPTYTMMALFNIPSTESRI